MKTYNDIFDNTINSILSDQERNAFKFAYHAHKYNKQYRKYTFEPYIVHPINVSIILKNNGINDNDTICAAYLHDVVEDVSCAGILHSVNITFAMHNDIHKYNTDSRDIKLSLIKDFFGIRVSDLVEMVTDVSKKSDGNRKFRKMLDCNHLINADKYGQTIKLADIIDNANDIINNDYTFAKVWVKEKKNQLDILTKGNKTLYDIAFKIVNNYLTKG